MFRILTLAAAFVAVLLLSPVAGKADDYGYYPEKEPLGLLDLDKNKCFYFPEWPKKDKVLYTDKYKLIKYGYDLKLICFFPLYYQQYLQDDEGFKCAIAKNYRIIKRTYDSEFEVKRHFALLKCDFEKKVHRPGYDY